MWQKMLWNHILSLSYGSFPDIKVELLWSTAERLLGQLILKRSLGWGEPTDDGFEARLLCVSPSQASFPERVFQGDTALTGMCFTAKNGISKELGLNKIIM